MKAILIDQGNHLRWTSVADPQLGRDDILIRVHAAALNRADILQREGNYPPPEGWPEWMGLEVAGEIVDMGAAAAAKGKWKIGERVCALLGGGGYAEYVAVPCGLVMPIPKGLSMVQAAALPEAYAASYMFLFVEGGLRPGETLLVQAGASGLASVLIPMAKAYGARVITTVLRETLVQRISHLGADVIVNTSRESLREALRAQAEAGHPLDIAIDCLGGAQVGECMPQMARGGRWIMIATLAGDISPVDMRAMYIKGLRLIGTTLRSRTPEAKEEILSRLVSDIWPFVEQGKILPTIYRTLPIQRAEEAQDILIRGENIGKVVMTVVDAPEGEGANA